LLDYPKRYRDRLAAFSRRRTSRANANRISSLRLSLSLTAALAASSSASLILQRMTRLAPLGDDAPRL